MAALLLLAVAVPFLFTKHAEPQLVWLTPAQVSQATHAGPLIRLRYALIRIAGPLLRFYRPRKPQVQIFSDILRLDQTPPANLGLGFPAGTNDDGTCAWVLSASDLSAFRARLKTAPGIFIVNSPRIITSNGGQDVMAATETFSMASADGKVSQATAGVILSVLPKVMPGAIRLIVGLDWSEKIVSASNSLSLKTNAAVSSRVLIANAGGLILHVSPQKEGGATNYWIIITTTATDSRGVPLKL